MFFISFVGEMRCMAVILLFNYSYISSCKDCFHHLYVELEIILLLGSQPKFVIVRFDECV